MKYKITHMECSKASKSWIVDMECRFPVRTQSTWISKRWTSEDVLLGHNIIIAMLKMWLFVRREIKHTQKIIRTDLTSREN